MNISRNERPSWYVPGKTQAEQQHLSEHERLQTLQKLALNGKTEELVDLLNTFPIDKQADLLNMVEEIKDDKSHLRNKQFLNAMKLLSEDEDEN